jgi:hypothetical protein
MKENPRHTDDSFLLRVFIKDSIVGFAASDMGRRLPVLDRVYTVGSGAFYIPSASTIALEKALAELLSETVIR